MKRSFDVLKQIEVPWRKGANMRAETLLRKLHLQRALTDAELQAYLVRLRPDGSLAPDETPALLQLLMQRTEYLSVDDIKAVSSLACGESHSSANVGSSGEEQAMLGIVSKLSK